MINVAKTPFRAGGKVLKSFAAIDLAPAADLTIIRNRLARPGPAILSTQPGHPFDQRSLTRLHSVLTEFS
jgi:hypothetical protein